ncbi:hypothetical protein Syun_019888 [Stephania yunnanensis]|uniref:AB hydrolase-1 domain-containing protein n=1 Tax=Stephania yunnanensis TaxID=152371 RepID=A0AAP0IUY5_9MAGN
MFVSNYTLKDSSTTTATMEKTKSVLSVLGRLINEVVSFIVFSFLDLLDVFLCFGFKVVDFLIEAEWKPCYCSSAKEAIMSSGKILVSEQGESKIVCCLSSSSKVQLEEISDTLYTRPSLASEISRTTVDELKKLKALDCRTKNGHKQGKNGTRRSTFTINSTIIEFLQGKVGGHPTQHIPRWSDCDCRTCNSWSLSCKDSLYVKTEGARGKAVEEDVLFVHGFLSSSVFWTETLFPNFSESTKSTHQLIAIDLLGFGRSPKPADSLYTLREHIDMIEEVIQQHKLKSFHIVAHSLGCILSLAIAARHPEAIKSLTLISPPYFPAQKGEKATKYVMRRIAPRRVWPLISFGASLACWYEHITRIACLLISKNHQLWESIAKLVTRNRMRTYLIEAFFCHTFNAGWHTLHNIIFGAASKIESYLDIVRNQSSCSVNVFHGKDDELIPLECSHAIQSKVPRAHVKEIENKDHITIVVGRQKAFARELEEIWKRSSSSTRTLT